MCSCSKPVPPLIHTLSLHDALPIFDTIRPKIIGDKDVIHLFGKMSPRQDIQPGVLGLTRAQTLQDPLGAGSSQKCRAAEPIVDPFTTGTVRQKGVPPPVKLESPRVHQPSGMHLQLPGLGSELPDPSPLHPPDTPGGLDMTENVDRLVEVEFAIRAPAERMDQVV